MAQNDLDVLLNSVLPFAEQTLAKYGELFPFGAGVDVGGQVAMLAADSGLGEHPASNQVLDALYEGARAEAASHRAVAFVADVRANGSDAVRIELEHREGVALVLLIPYSRSIHKEDHAGTNERRHRGAPHLRRLGPSHRPIGKEPETEAHGIAADICGHADDRLVSRCHVSHDSRVKLHTRDPGGVTVWRRSFGRMLFCVTAVVVVAGCNGSETPTPDATFSAAGNSRCEIVYHQGGSQTSINVDASTNGKLTVNAVGTDGTTYHHSVDVRSKGLVHMTAPISEIKTLRGRLVVANDLVRCSVAPA